MRSSFVRGTLRPSWLPFILYVPVSIGRRVFDAPDIALILTALIVAGALFGSRQHLRGSLALWASGLVAIVMGASFGVFLFWMEASIWRPDITEAELHRFGAILKVFDKTQGIYALSILIWAWLYLRSRRDVPHGADHSAHLQDLELLPIRSTIGDAIATYGQPVKESKPEDGPDDAKQHTFEMDGHQIVVTEWKGHAHRVAYWPATSNPRADLKYIGDFYGQGMTWKTLTEGYMYRRSDDQIMLWCSVAPGIGVGTVEYSKACKG